MATTATSPRTVSIELELELDYVGLTDKEIETRCMTDMDPIVEAINEGKAPILPPHVVGFRLHDRGGGYFFPRHQDQAHASNAS